MSKVTRWQPRDLALAGTLALACALWYVTFVLAWSDFWIKISCSAATLALLSVVAQRGVAARFVLDRKAVVIGLGSAVVLYLVFFVGKVVSSWLFDFAEGQVDGIYGLGEGSRLWAVAILLFAVTGPCEELYWRGYVQRRLSERLGGFPGYLVATALYAGVHLWTWNVMLVGAAAVAGAFWGLLYWRLGNLAPVVISHSVWSAVIFAVLPMQ